MTDTSKHAPTGDEREDLVWAIARKALDDPSAEADVAWAALEDINAYLANNRRRTAVPTDDEREALFGAIYGATDREGWAVSEVVDAVLAAGFPRAAVQGPTDSCSHEACEIDTVGNPTRCADCGATGVTA